MFTTILTEHFKSLIQLKYKKSHRDNTCDLFDENIVFENYCRGYK